MKLGRSVLAPGAVLAIAVLTGGWLLQQGVSQEENLYNQVRLFEEVVDHVSSRYVDEVDRQDLYESAIRGMLERLEDPNTSFLRADQYENLRIRTEGQYGGVGLEITERGGWVTVVSPLPGTPGSRAGLRAGDRIVEVEGESTEGWDVNQAVQVLRGEPGSDVEIRVRRPGVEGPIPFTLTRERIQIRSVPFLTMLDDGIGYVPLRTVSEGTGEEVRAAIDSLAAQEVLRGLVLDLRANPGGLLDQGVALSDLLLDPGQEIVETRGRARGQSQTFEATGDQRFRDLPVVVLLDERSASASEIVAGALQDHDRALVVGLTSFGKGSVQTLYRLSGGNVLKLTTARWYTPAGRSIDKPHREAAAPSPDEEAGVLTLEGQFVQKPDTAARPTFTTGSGRTIYGGGGITPDLLVLPDTLATDEQQAVRRLFRVAGGFSTALFNHAVDYLQRHPDLERDFEVTAAEMDRFYQRLPEWNVEVDRETFDGAERFIRFQLERNIAQQEWGDEGEFLRTLPHDPQLLRALELLRSATSPESLFRLAGAAAPDDESGEPQLEDGTGEAPEGESSDGESPDGEGAGAEAESLPRE